LLSEKSSVVITIITKGITMITKMVRIINNDDEMIVMKVMMTKAVIILMLMVLLMMMITASLSSKEVLYGTQKNLQT